MVEHGMRPMDAIIAATRTAANLLNLLDVTGLIEPGKAADLLVLDGDPLVDIRSPRDPNRVVGVMSADLWVHLPPAR